MIKHIHKGRDKAWPLLKTCLESLYSQGTEERLMTPDGGWEREMNEGIADLWHWAWQKLLQLMMEAVDQSMCGLCVLRHGRPSTTGRKGEEITNCAMLSCWLPDIERVMGMVWWVTLLNNCLSKATWQGNGPPESLNTEGGYSKKRLTPKWRLFMSAKSSQTLPSTGQ